MQDSMETCARCLEPFVARDENIVPGSIVAAAAKLGPGDIPSFDTEPPIVADDLVEPKPKPKKKPKPIKKAEYKPAKKTTKGK